MHSSGLDADEVFRFCSKIMLSIAAAAAHENRQEYSDARDEKYDDGSDRASKYVNRMSVLRL